MYSFYQKVPVQAFQWQGQEVEGCSKSWDDGIDVKSRTDENAQLFIPMFNSNWRGKIARFGDWIVLEPGGQFTIYHDSDFQKVYNPVEVGE